MHVYASNSYLQQNAQYEKLVTQFVQVQTNEDDELYFKNYQALCNRCSIMRRRRIIKLFAIAAPWWEEEEEEFVGGSAS